MGTPASGKRNIKRFRAALLALLLFLSAAALSVNACAGDGGAKAVRIVMDDSDLFIRRDADGKPIGGYGYEYIQYVAGYAGWTVEYVPGGSFADCMQAVTDGKADLLFGISRTGEREALLLYPDTPMGAEDCWLYGLSGNESLRSGDCSSYNGKTVGITKDAAQIEALRQWCAENGVALTFREFESIPEKEAALEAGEIDLNYEISLLAGENYSALSRVTSSDYYLAVSKARPDLLEDLNTACRKIGEVNPYFVMGLNQKYFSRSVLNRTLSKDEQAWVERHSVLKIGYMDDYLPFSERLDDGSPNGIVRDIVPLMLRNIGLENLLPVEYTAYADNAAMFAALKAGEIDAVFPVYNNPEFGADNGISVSSKVISLSADMVVRENTAGDPVSSIAVNRNNLLQDYYTRACYPDSRLVYFDTIEDALTAVAEGRVGSTILNGLRTSALLSDSACKDLTSVKLLEPFSFSFAVDQGNSSLLSLLNRTVLSMEDGFALNFAFQYINAEPDISFLGFLRQHKEVLLQIAVVVLLLLVVAAVIMSVTLAKSRKKLEEANAAKTRFLFNMSHDIRTPMNAILGFTEMADKCSEDPEKVADCHSKIRQAGNLMLSLINSVLEMSRIEAGNTELHESPTSVDRSFTGIKATMQAYAKQKNIDLRFEFGDVQDNYVFADTDRADRIFINIISNAVQYTDFGGSVKVKCEQLGRPDETHGLYRYTFEDNGIGMSEEYLKHMFEAFSRENTSTASGVQGAGLGLPVSRALVELLHGTIECRSKQGVGTVFTVTLPFRLQPFEGAAESDDRKTEVRAAESDGRQTEVRSVLPPEAENEVPSPVAGKRVLLVEDNALNREVARFLFEEADMTVEEADDGAAAVAMLREKGPQYYDIVLMDIQMPVMDGLEATREIRRMYPDAKLPVIALSANAFDEDRARSLEAGMNDHISKPINIQELLTVLAKYL